MDGYIKKNTQLRIKFFINYVTPEYTTGVIAVLGKIYTYHFYSYYFLK